MPEGFLSLTPDDPPGLELVRELEALGEDAGPIKHGDGVQSPRGEGATRRQTAFLLGADPWPGFQSPPPRRVHGARTWEDADR